MRRSPPVSNPKTIPVEVEEAINLLSLVADGTYGSDRSVPELEDTLRAAIRRALDEQVEACAKVCEGMATGRSEIKTIGLPRFIGEWAVVNDDAAYLAWAIRRLKGGGA
jgi:hypothetical protein